MNSNKLIAEFMGLPKVACNIGTSDGCITEGYMHPKVNVPVTTSGMQYNISWDWLMPVVEKIYSMDADVDFFKNINLEATYKAVVEFIKNYKNN